MACGTSSERSSNRCNNAREYPDGSLANSMSKMAKELGISGLNVRNIVRNTRSTAFTFGTKDVKRLGKIRRILCLLASAHLSKVLFPDGNSFETLHKHRHLLNTGQQKTVAVRTIYRSPSPSWTARRRIDRNVKVNAATYQQRVLHNPSAQLDPCFRKTGSIRPILQSMFAMTVSRLFILEKKILGHDTSQRSRDSRKSVRASSEIFVNDCVNLLKPNICCNFLF
ncbi:hypothetical protein LAZ67_2006038 [Cordylochernes scorpioides]|uniref:Uncharacterized protein n=1 Tax=Cordylochernes scorpioides TaxID=51811 RepID=A0ABY6K4Y2_9ARAC|nr:hypothetical protein LAZ67_2006038 [Cordylochernes scorpioides]